MQNFTNHGRGLYLSPYIVFLRGQALFSPWATYPEVAPYIPLPANHHIKRHSWYTVRTRATTGWQQERIESRWSSIERPEKSLKVIHAIGLSITFGNKSGLIPIHRTIWVILQSIDPATITHLWVQRPTPIPREIKAYISSSMVCFQEGTNIGSSYDQGIDTEDNDMTNWRKEGLRRS